MLFIDGPRTALLLAHVSLLLIYNDDAVSTYYYCQVIENKSLF